MQNLVGREYEVEQCGFVRKYAMFGNETKGSLYQLMDVFTLFWIKFMRKAGTGDPRFLTTTLVTPAHAAWAGLAFDSCRRAGSQARHICVACPVVGYA